MDKLIFMLLNFDTQMTELKEYMAELLNCLIEENSKETELLVQVSDH